MKNEQLKDIISFAVENEIDAYKFYKNASEKIKDNTLKETFKDLADEELKHKKFLEDFLSSDVNTIELNDFSDYKIAETVDKPALTIDMDFSEAIALAMKKEEEAMDMYKNLADVCKNNEQKELFLGLMKMEQMHKSRLEDIYVNVAYTEVW